MNKRSLEIQFMLQSVVGLAKKNQTITDLVPAYKSGITQVNSFVNQLTALAGPQSQTIGGTGATKEFERNLLNNISADTLAAARSWAVETGNEFLASQLNFPYSAVKRISDKNIAAKATAWIGLIQPHIASMANWNLTPETIASWEAVIEDYNDVYLFPKNELKSREKKTADIKKLIKTASDYCHNVLDGAAVPFKSNGNQSYYELYRLFRKIIPVATKHGKFRVLVIDDANNPINNVKVLQDGTDNAVYTDINGQASLEIIYNKNVPKSQLNVYNFTLSNTLGQIKTGPIVIKHNSTYSKTYVMQPADFVIPVSTPVSTPELVNK